MSDYKVSRHEWSALDLQKLASDGVQLLKIIGEKVAFELPINFFREIGESALQKAITQESLLSILDRFEEVYSIQAEFAGFKDSHKIPIVIRQRPLDHEDPYLAAVIPLSMYINLWEILEKETGALVSNILKDAQQKPPAEPLQKSWSNVIAHLNNLFDTLDLLKIEEELTLVLGEPSGSMGERFEKSAKKIAELIKNMVALGKPPLEGVDLLQKQLNALPELKKLASTLEAEKITPSFMDLPISEPDLLLNWTSQTDTDENSKLIFIVAHEFGHYFEHIGSPSYKEDYAVYKYEFNEIWSDLFAAYTCERLSIPFHKDRYPITAVEKYGHSEMGSYASLSLSYSSYAHAMLMEIKDLYATQTHTDGWNVFKNLFHKLWEKPVPEEVTNEERWLWIRDLILETSQIDVAPIFYKYHVPLPEGTYIPPRVELIAEGDENLLIAGEMTLSSIPSTYVLKGNEGRTTMYGTARNDTYYGGPGQDVLKFVDENHGKDIFYDFDPLMDHITIKLSEEQAPIIKQNGDDSIFSFKNGDFLTLKNVNCTQLTQENVTFLRASKEKLSSGDDGGYWTNMVNFEHTKSRARQFGDDIILLDSIDPSILPNKKILDLKETDFSYRKYSEVPFDEIIKNDLNSQPPSPEEPYDAMGEYVMLGALGGIGLFIGLELLSS